MKRTAHLPEHYREIYTIDLQKNKKIALLINGLAIVVTVLLILLGQLRVSISTLFDSEDLVAFLVRMAVLGVGAVVYIVLHELIHGAAMRICGTKKIKYGFTGMYAFAGSEDYYGKGAYIFIALAPVVLWGVVLAVICFLVPDSWFWVVYFIQIFNLSGAAGDAFVTCRFAALPKDILVRDYGVGMKVYAPRAAAGNCED